MLTMATTATIFAVLQRDGLVERAARLGDEVMDRLQGYAQSCTSITEVRGHGLFIGVALNLDGNTAYQSGADVARTCLDRGLIINATGSNVLRLAPPLTIGEDELHQGIDILMDVLGQ